MLNELLQNKMEQVGTTPTALSRKTDLNIATVRKALAGNGRLDTFHKLAEAMSVKIVFKLEDK